jgi:HD-GYP domain-containing protein (c-di-GMP phosphodiesterase class II)
LIIIEETRDKCNAFMSTTEIEENSIPPQNYCDALNILIFECLGDSAFQLLSSVPTGFQAIYPEILKQDNSPRPDQRFPYIEHFLEDAYKAWISEKIIKSGPWIETGIEGKDIALEASARVWKSKRLLCLEILGDAYDAQHNMLQIGRENLLVKQFMEKLVRESVQELREREEEIALRLVWAAEAKDGGETGTHIRRIGLYSAEMARAVGWHIDDIDDIRIAATMHDVGKIAIPDVILRKPDSLNEKEFEIMKTHTVMGGRILGGSKTKMINMAKDIALYHHEQWDGSGYPSGLEGDDIPMSARIVSLVDVYDALVTKRIYKEAWTEDDAIESMLKDRGKRFDPELFDTFLSLLDVFREIANKEYPPLFEGFNENYTY